ncbi:MAG: VIT1/CCC1 transporter family protein, partial [Acidobacteriota bacterium]
MEPRSSEETRSLAALKADHTPEAVRRRLGGGPDTSYLRDFVYGAIDGAVTTFAIVAGIAGAELSATIVLVLGFANLLADGFRMAVSNFLGTRAELQLRERSRRIEEEHIRLYPDGEREEIRQIYAAKGFAGDELERVVTVITAERRQWVDTMMTEELGLPLEGPDPRKAALVTFVAFVVVGALPLVTFVLPFVSSVELARPFLWSAVLTGVAFFVVGAT